MGDIWEIGCTGICSVNIGPCLGCPKLDIYKQASGGRLFTPGSVCYCCFLKMKEAMPPCLFKIRSRNYQQFAIICDYMCILCSHCALSCRLSADASGCTPRFGWCHRPSLAEGFWGSPPKAETSRNPREITINLLQIHSFHFLRENTKNKSHLIGGATRSMSWHCCLDSESP